MSFDEEQQTKDRILADLQTIDNTEYLNEINALLNQKNEDKLAKISGININSTGGITLWDIITDPQNPIQINIPIGQVKKIRLHTTVTLRIVATDINAVYANAFQAVNRLGLYGYKINDQTKEQSPLALIYTLSRSYETRINEII